jgi:hypothetical protein
MTYEGTTRVTEKAQAALQEAMIRAGYDVDGQPGRINNATIAKVYADPAGGGIADHAGVARYQSGEGIGNEAYGFLQVSDPLGRITISHMERG